MSDLLRPRPRPAEQAIHLRYEKAGLTLPAPPVPWNADALIVELTAALPPAARQRGDFTLRLAGLPAIPAEVLRKADTESGPFRVIFRAPVPTVTIDAEVLWKSRLLATVSIPVQSADEYLNGIRLTTPTTAIRIADQTVAAQTFVASQNRGLTTSLVVRSATGLAPLIDLVVDVLFQMDDGTSTVVKVPLTSSQYAAREALVTAVPPRAPRRAGQTVVSWRIGGKVVRTHRLVAVTMKRFTESLRVSDARYVVADRAGTMRVVRATPPMTEVSRIGPCFLVASREPGAAGMLTIQVTATVPGAVAPPVLLEETVLVTDGPTMVAPGLIDVADLGTATGFELRHKGSVLGVLSFSPVPTASFTSEGGFNPPPDFAWTTTAEDELTERLGKLFGSS